MLGRLRMTIGHCLDQYRIVGDGLFGKERSWIPYIQAQYYHEPLEKVVKRLVAKQRFGTLHP